MNRDLSRRVRSVNGLTSHKQIVRHDIKLSAKIVHNLDNKVGLWREEKKDETKQEEDKENKTTRSSNEIEQAVNKICVYICYIMYTGRNLAHNYVKLFILGFWIVI